MLSAPGSWLLSLWEGLGRDSAQVMVHKRNTIQRYKRMQARHAILSDRGGLISEVSFGPP